MHFAIGDVVCVDQQLHHLVQGRGNRGLEGSAAAPLKVLGGGGVEVTSVAHLSGPALKISF